VKVSRRRRIAVMIEGREGQMRQGGRIYISWKSQTT
jgi:hypothetical protein